MDQPDGRRGENVLVLPNDTDGQVAVLLDRMRYLYDTRVGELDKECNRLRGVVENQNRRLGEWERTCSGLEQEVSDLRTTHRHLESAHAAIKVENSRLESELARCRDVLMKGLAASSTMATEDHTFSQETTTFSPSRSKLLQEDEYTMKTPKVVDGREFFRTVRQTLRGQAYTDFLEALRRLNAGQQDETETVRIAQKVFLPYHPELLDQFSDLLQQHSGNNGR